MIDYSFIEEENKYLLNKQNYSIRRQALYPSEASVEYTIDGRTHVVGKCLRAAFLRAIGEPKTNPSGMHLIMTGMLGSLIEKATINRWKEMGIYEDNNVKFFDSDLVLSGELDILTRIVGNKKIGIEHKTYGNVKAETELYGKKGVMKKDGTWSDKLPRIYGQPKEHQFLQSELYDYKYVHQLKLLDEFRMYYFNRENGHRAEFVIGSDEQPDGTHKCWWQQVPGDYWVAYQPVKIYRPYTIEDIHARSRKLIHYIQRKELPPKDFEYAPSDNWVEWAGKNNIISTSKCNKHFETGKKREQYFAWECSYCDYRDRCQGMKE